MRLANPPKNCSLIIWLIYLAVFVLQLDFVTAPGRACSNGKDNRADLPLCKLVDFSAAESVPFQSPQVFTHLVGLSAKTTNKVYPTRVDTIKSLQRYDELPFPVPIGLSLYLCTLTLVFLAWYAKTCFKAALQRMADTIQLFPETTAFPNVKLYSLQQSKREGSLRREARNTWAWMANKYLLLPNDPKVNTDVFKTTWSDFDLPKNVWAIVRGVMKVTALFNRAKQRISKGVPLKTPNLLSEEPYDRKKEELKDRLEELKKDVDPHYQPVLNNVVTEAPEETKPHSKNVLKKKASVIPSRRSRAHPPLHHEFEDPLHLLTTDDSSTISEGSIAPIVMKTEGSNLLILPEPENPTLPHPPGHKRKKSTHVPHHPKGHKPEGPSHKPHDHPTSQKKHEDPTPEHDQPTSHKKHEDPTLEHDHHKGHKKLEDPTLEHDHPTGHKKHEDPTLEHDHHKGHKKHEDPTLELDHHTGHKKQEDPTLEEDHPIGHKKHKDPIHLHQPGHKHEEATHRHQPVTQDEELMFEVIKDVPQVASSHVEMPESESRILGEAETGEPKSKKKHSK